MEPAKKKSRTESQNRSQSKSQEVEPARPAVATKPSAFDPLKHGLSADFVLTDYTRLKGCSCKIPQLRLLDLLHTISTEPGKVDGNVGMDCSIVPVRDGSLSMVSTTDFFFPSVEDPYLQGRIGCANVLSDLYAMGIDKCDSMLMLLAASSDMDEQERWIVTADIMKGFADTAREAGTDVTGGQSVINPWPLIGGVAMSVVREDEMVRPVGIRSGDVLVLTKPLGTQLAVNLKQWVKRPSPIYLSNVKGKMSPEEIDALYDDAARNMGRLNRNAAKLMKKYGAHAATDITGFGLMGHTTNLSQAQEREKVTLEIHTMPIMRGAIKGDELLNGKYKLMKGESAETSGGLLVALSTEVAAQQFMADLQSVDGTPSWIVGIALMRDGSSTDYAHLSPNVRVIPV